ncbi:Hypothetical protein CINCED_3A004587 [Cinara cedri]|uniref:Uncharacterized protein n=1 Tax=Cinara cedri TaxID=506608 RepID=A0A5E4M414_9HEMI|nr:Hypothetical protein CINCED_3A004587 [Cinara cedri]
MCQNYRQVKNYYKKVYVPPIRKEDGSWVCCEQNKAYMYARHLERLLQPNDIVSELDITHRQPLNEIPKKIKHFTLIKISKEIDMNINPKKVSGYDHINTKILKELSKKAMI